MFLHNGFDLVEQQISKYCSQSSRSRDDVCLVAVSKTKPEQDIQEAYEAGLRDFGENYIQELQAKMQSIQYPDIRWHFIGQLQSNKVKYIVPGVWLIHSLDSLSAAKEIQKRAAAASIVQNVLIQVNISEEQQKGGVSPEQLPAFVSEVSQMPHISIRGLMGIPPFDATGDQATPFFLRLRELAANLPDGIGRSLSMGMTSDFPQAIMAGATYIRIGSALFGSRNTQHG